MPPKLYTYDDMQKYNTFRQPDWRFARVQQLVERFPTPGRCSRRDDRYVREARSFVLQWRTAQAAADRQQLFFDHPGLWYAYQYYERASLMSDLSYTYMIEARLLAGQGFDEIAVELNTIPEAIEWYEAMFFNVVDRLHARDWITRTVIVPAILRQSPAARLAPVALDDHALLPAQQANFDEFMSLPFYDATLKLFAYAGGPLAVDFFLHGFRAGRRLVSLDDAGGWLDGILSDTVRRRVSAAAQVMPVNKFNSVELVQCWLQLRQLEIADEDPNRHRSKLEKHIQAFLSEVPMTAGDSQALTLRPYREHLDGPDELTDEEILTVASGQPIRDTQTFKDMPAPRTRTLQSPDLEELE